MPHNQKTSVHLLEEINHLSLWMSRHGLNNPIAAIKTTFEEEQKKLKIIADEAKQLIHILPTFIDRAIKDSTSGEKVAKEFMERSKPLLQLLNKTLQHHRKTVENIATTLQTLSQELTNGIMHLTRYFKKQILPLQNQSPIKHHAMNFQNAAEKSRFTSHLAENHPTLHHRNISPRSVKKS